MDLLSVDTVDEARTKLLQLAAPALRRSELVPTPKALGRVLAADLVAGVDIPAFTRSTVDGYAVRAADTAGAGESIPSILALAGAVEMGADAASFRGLSQGIAAGECAYVPTGGMLPAGADAMVMVEHTEFFGSARVGIYTPVALGENVVKPGDDIAAGTLACKEGTLLGAAELGVAAALGATQLTVYERPRIFIISTGDEIIAPEAAPARGQVRDINSWALAAQAELAGFDVVGSEVVIDEETLLAESVDRAMQRADVVVVSGGSSQGEKDATAKIIGAAASSGVLTHGLALKPGKPTISGYDEPSQTILIGLPGHPLSAMMVFEVLVSWLVREARKVPPPLPVPAVLSQNIPVAAGKDTLQLVRLSEMFDTGELPVGDSRACTLVATPVYTKSGLISKLSEASGYIWIDRNVEGLVAGAPVAVHLLKTL